MLKIFGGVGILLVVAVLVLLSPFAVIWSLNTLFGLTIGYTFKNWLAVEVIWCLFTAGARGSNRS